MKRSLKLIFFTAGIMMSVAAFAQAPLGSVPAGGPNAYPGGTPTQSPNGAAQGYNSGYTIPAGAGGVVNSNSNGNTVPGTSNGPIGATGPSGTPSYPSGGSGPNNSVPQNIGRNDVFSPGNTPQ